MIFKMLGVVPQAKKFSLRKLHSTICGNIPRSSQATPSSSNRKERQPNKGTNGESQGSTNDEHGRSPSNINMPPGNNRFMYKVQN